MSPNGSKAVLRELRISRPLNPANRLEATLIANPHVTYQTLWTIVSSDRQVLLMHFHGPPEELESLRRGYLEQLSAEVETLEVVQRSRRDLYALKVERSGVEPTDISGLIYSVLGPENHLQVSKDREGVEWRILTTRPERVPAFLKKLEAHGRRLRQKFSPEVSWYKVDSLHASPLRALAGLEELNAVEERALRTAARLGYFEQPRRASVNDLARALKVPRSTAHYQLKRAERKALAVLLRE